MFCEVKVNNVPKTCNAKFIVAKYCPLDDELWFSSAHDNYEEARKSASNIEGVVCKAMEVSTCQHQ